MSTWEKYRDMIDLPYPGESKHTRMPVRDRAAQFAPFAALTGFGAVLKETERITEKRIELDEYEKEKLNENLRLLLEKQESRPEITVTFFVPDEKKDGGAYRTISGHIKRVDEESHCLILEDGERILLTKYAGRNNPNYALIAGFTEIGETAEETVMREVYEEVGVRVKNLRYYKTQPWGMASDLLIGYYAELDGDPSITLDRNELSTGLWMDRKDIIIEDEDFSLTREMIVRFAKTGRAVLN